MSTRTRSKAEPAQQQAPSQTSDEVMQYGRVGVPRYFPPDITLAQVPKTEEQSIHRTWLQSFDRQRLLRHVDKLETRVAAQRKEIGRLHGTNESLLEVLNEAVKPMPVEALTASVRQYTPPAIQSVNALKWTIIGVAVLAAVDFYFKYLQVYFQK